MPLREAARPAPKACEHSVESPRLRPIPIESPDILLYIFPSAAPAYCERTWSKWPTKASVTRSLAQLHRFRSIAGHAKRHNWLRLASCASAVYPHCGRCDCQPFTCRRRHASMPTSARAFSQCPARHLLREILASSPTTVVLRRFPQHPSVGGIFPSTVGQHRRRVVPGEELTYISAALRTSSTRDKPRRV